MPLKIKLFFRLIPAVPENLFSGIPLKFRQIKIYVEIFTCSASDFKISITWGSNKPPKKSVASLGNWVGMLSIEQIKTPGP